MATHEGDIKWPVLAEATPANVDELIADLLTIPKGNIWQARVNEAIRHNAHYDEQEEIRHEMREKHAAHLGNRHVDYALGKYAGTIGALIHRDAIKRENPEIYAELKDGFKRFDDVTDTTPSAERKAKQWNRYREVCLAKNQEHEDALKLIPTFEAGDRIHLCDKDGFSQYGIYIGPTTDPVVMPVQFQAHPVKLDADKKPIWSEPQKRSWFQGSYTRLTKVEDSPSKKRVKVSQL
jgi:hypothetical protein